MNTTMTTLPEFMETVISEDVLDGCRKNIFQNVEEFLFKLNDDDEQKSHAHVIILAIIEGEPDVLFRLMYALRSECKSFLYDDVSIEDPYSSITSGTILHYAAHFGNIQIVKELILSDAPRCSLMDPDVITVAGYTPLHMASRSGNAEIVQILIEAEADVTVICSSVNDFGGLQTALHEAVISRNTQVVQILLDAGANIEAENEQDRTPLHLAMLNNDVNVSLFCWFSANKMIRILLKEGSDVNAEDMKGQTPLHMASGYADNVEILRILIDAGADNESI